MPARLGGLKSLCFKSILSYEKKTTCQPVCRQTGLKVQDRGKFSMTEVCPWPKGGKRLLWLERVKLLLAGKLNRGKRVVSSELAGWDCNCLPGLAVK